MSADRSGLQRRRSRVFAESSALWLSGIAALVILVVAVVITTVILGRPDDDGSPVADSPAAAVHDFLHAVAAADSEQALRLITPAPSRTFLGAGALRRGRQAAPITDIVVGHAVQASATASTTSVYSVPEAVVPVDFRIGNHQVHTRYRVVAEGSRWLVADAVSPVPIATSPIPGVSLLGVSATGIGTAYVFPGRLVWGSGLRFLGVRASVAGGSADDVDVVGGTATTGPVELRAELTESGVAAVHSSITAYLRGCASSTQADASTDRPGCVQRLYRSAKVSSVRWRPPSDLDELISEVDQADPTRISVFGSVTWNVEYSATYGGEANDVVAQPMEGTVDLAAQPTPVYAPAR